MINSLRAIGYSFNTALADLLDNSIAASATKIAIQLRLEPSTYVAILDNGSGMSKAILTEAMRHGGVGPNRVRRADDLGRYGLGLKTASLSQCRRLTVVTLAGGKLAAARWDLDEVEARNEWYLSVLSATDISTLPHVSDLRENHHGTLVLWEDFDRATAGEAHPGVALERLVDESRDHLSLVFHRYLSGDSTHKKLSIKINALELEPIDPFLSSNKRTEMLPAEKLHVEGAIITIQPYILPHLSNIRPDEIRTAGGKDRLRQSQGFYVYRNRRLIISGTWFRLIRQDELTKLARVQIDVPNSLDHLWSLDVKKSAANPPEQVRLALSRIVDRIADRSHNVFRNRRRKPTGVIKHLWDRNVGRNGIEYTISRTHPAVKELSDDLSETSRARLDAVLRLLEVGIPVDSIFHDMASDRSVEPTAESVQRDLRAQVDLWLSAAPHDQIARQNLLDALPMLEPFSMYPVITRQLVEDLRNAQ